MYSRQLVRTCGKTLTDSELTSCKMDTFAFLQANTGPIIEMANPAIQEVDDGVVFTAKIVPGSSGPTRFCGLLDGMVKI